MKHSRKKSLAVLLVAVVFSMRIFSAEKISAIVENEIANFFQLRMELALCTSSEIAIEKIDERHAEFIKKSEQIPFTEEEMLILENFVVLERQNYMRDINRKDPELEKLMMAQKRKNDAWFKAHKKDVHNKWLYCTAADMIGCSMTWMSVFEIIRDGLNVKKYYEIAIKQDPYMSYAYTNLAQWHMYAPGICGGSKKKMREYFNFASQIAQTAAEKYFADIFLSQVYFDDKKYDNSEEMLNLVDNMLPGGYYVARIRKMNENGTSLFVYNRRYEDGERGGTADLKTIVEAMKQAKAEKEREEKEEN